MLIPPDIDSYKMQGGLPGNLWGEDLHKKAWKLRRNSMGPQADETLM